tara:strand:- start:431 stop:616 length:186 start_codon:yes stop_codon:yes gene_type:complete
MKEIEPVDFSIFRQNFGKNPDFLTFFLIFFWFCRQIRHFWSLRLKGHSEPFVTTPTTFFLH